MSSSATFTGRVRWLSVGFVLVFVAYSSAQLLQTALNGDRGYECLFAVYATFGLFSLYAPALVAALGPNRLLPAAACGYAFMVGANLYPGEGLLVPSCVFVGACAAALWSAQAVYVGQVALALSRSEARELTLCTSELNAAFYSRFMFSGAVSGLFSSAVFFSGVPNAVFLLFLLLTGVACAGVGALLALPRAEDPSTRTVALPGCGGTENVPLVTDGLNSKASDEFWLGVAAGPTDRAAANASAEAVPVEAAAPGDAAGAPAVVAAIRPTLLYMVRFLATDRRMRFIIPTIFVNGAGAGFVNGVWMGRIVSARLGVQHVGLVGALYAVISSFAATQVWGRLAQRPSFGRRWCFVGSLAIYSLWYALFALYAAATPANDGAPSPATFAILFIGAAVHGFADPVLSSFIPATLQVFFSGGRDALCAMSSVRVVYSLGFALQQALSIGLAARGGARIAEQASLLAALTLLAGAALAYLQLRVYSIDGEALALEATSAPAASAPAAAAPVPAAVAPAPKTAIPAPALPPASVPEATGATAPPERSDALSRNSLA